MKNITSLSRLLSLCIATAALCACKGLPTYQPQPNQPLATIKLSPTIATDTLGMCDSAVCYVLKPIHGELQVPVDHRLVLYKVLVASGYRVMYSCTPALSFVPYAGTTYYVDFALRAEHCFLNLYRENPGSRVGIAFDPTVRGIPAKR